MQGLPKPMYQVLLLYEICKDDSAVLCGGTGVDTHVYSAQHTSCLRVQAFCTASLHCTACYPPAFAKILFQVPSVLRFFASLLKSRQMVVTAAATLSTLCFSGRGCLDATGTAVQLHSVEDQRSICNGASHVSTFLLMGLRWLGPLLLTTSVR